MTSDLNYKQKVLLAAYELCKEFPSDKGYDISISQDGDLLMTPWHDIPGRPGRRKTYSRFLRVTNERIFGSDETLVSELENKVRELDR